jgi:hypothetical protein
VAADALGHVLFRIVGIVMRVAPLGAMAFTIGKFGIGTLLNMGKLVACFYATSLMFVFIRSWPPRRRLHSSPHASSRPFTSTITLCKTSPHFEWTTKSG